MLFKVVWMVLECDYLRVAWYCWGCYADSLANEYLFLFYPSQNTSCTSLQTVASYPRLYCCFSFQYATVYLPLFYCGNLLHAIIKPRKRKSFADAWSRWASSCSQSPLHWRQLTSGSWDAKLNLSCNLFVDIIFSAGCWFWRFWMHFLRLTPKRSKGVSQKYIWKNGNLLLLFQPCLIDWTTVRYPDPGRRVLHQCCRYDSHGFKYRRQQADVHSHHYRYFYWLSNSSYL